MKDKTLDMTQGNSTALLIRFSIPMLIGNLFQQLYNLVDSVVVGKLVGADALAAIGVTSSISFFFFAICNGIGSGGGIVTSQYFGRKDTGSVKSCIANVGYIMTIFPTAIGLIAFFLAKPLLYLLGTPEAIYHDALGYLRIVCLATVFVSLYNYISSMLRALGDSRTPLYFLIFSCILNTILDLIFVQGLHMSVIGAGVATIISQFVSGISCLIYAVKTNPYFKLSKADFQWNKTVVNQSVKIGAPLSLQFSLIAISSMAIQRAVNGFGAVAVAAFTATGRIEQLIHQPYQTLSAALSTHTGQNYGAGNTDRMRNGYKKSLEIMAIFSLVMTVLMQFFSRHITLLFVNEPAVVDMGETALRITSLFYLFLGIIYTTRGILNGVGDSVFAISNGVIEVIGRCSLPFILTIIPVIGVWGLWWSTGLVWFIAGLAAIIRYFQVRNTRVVGQHG